MSSSKKLLLALLLLPVVIYLGLKFMIYRNTKSSLEQLTAMAAPFMSVRYDGIGSSLGGAVQISNVKLQPNNLNDVIRIKNIEIQTPGLWFLLTGKDKLSEGDFPESMRLSLEGVAVDMDGPMMGMLDKLLEADAGEYSVAHCGGIQALGPRLYRKLGYNSLVSDIRLGYELDKKSARLHVRTEWNTEDMSLFNVDLFFAGVPGAAKDMAQFSPRMTEAKAYYKDVAYTERLKRYCASASNISVEDYINAEVGQESSSFAQQWGLVPGPGLREAYRQFLTAPGEIRFEMRPSEGIDPANMNLFRPEDLVAMLNATLTVNGTPVTDLSFQLKPKTVAKASENADPGVSSTSEERVAQKSGYQVVRNTELPKYIGRSIRIREKRAAVREGVLAEVSATQVTLERRYGGGSVTFKVPIKEIEKVEVLF